MIVRRIEEKDYKTISQWCRDWRFPDLTQQRKLLPHNQFIVSDAQGIDIVCCFLYLTDSVFCHPEWIISNKNYKNKAARKQALQMLFEEISHFAQSNGYEIYLMSVRNKSLINNLKEIGFIETDTCMTNLIKSI